MIMIRRQKNNFLKIASQEFVETEQFIKAAEEICGEYVWKR